MWFYFYLYKDMKYILSIILILTPTLCCIAQIDSDTDNAVVPLGKITYVFKSIWIGGEALNRDAVLLFNGDYSLFYHSRGKAPTFNIGGKEDCSEGCYEVDEIGRLVFKDFIKDSLQLREIAFYQAYISGESIPQLTWKIYPETKKIGNFTSQKATTEFRGRNYSAWFTTDIPISDGPWKFSGLPGMILEVSSDDGQYAFLYKSIEMPVRNGSSEPIVFANDGLKVDFKTFIRADELEFEKQRKKSEAKWLSSGGQPGGYTWTRTVPDPIELNFDGMED